MIVILVDNSTKDHFLDQILSRRKSRKTEETRTEKSFQKMEKAGLELGDSVGLAYHGWLYGYATFDHVMEYGKDLKAFRKAFKAHHVRKGSQYDIDARGKIGIGLADPVRLNNPVWIGKQTRPTGFVIL